MQLYLKDFHKKTKISTGFFNLKSFSLMKKHINMHEIIFYVDTYNLPVTFVKKNIASGYEIINSIFKTL